MLKNEKRGINIHIIAIVILFLLCNRSSIYSQSKYAKMDYDGNLYFKVFINDSIEGNFDFDSGASVCFLDSLFFSKNRISKKATVFHEISGGGEMTNKIEVLLDTIKISNPEGLNCIQNYVPIINLKKIGGKKSDGIIGLSALKQNTIKVDYVKGTIEFNKSKTKFLKYSKIPFDLIDSKICILSELKINDTLTIRGNFIIDTGSPNTINLTHETAKKYDLLNTIKNKKRYYSAVYGIGGNSAGYLFRSKEIKVSHFVVKDKLIDFSIDTSGSLSKGNYVGIIGNGLLENFDIVFDFPNQVIFLSPNKKFNKPTYHSTLGFSFVDRTDIDKGWVVAFFFNNSNSEKAGLKLGDIITHVNGISVEKINRIKFRKKYSGKNRLIRLDIQRESVSMEICFTTQSLDL